METEKVVMTQSPGLLKLAELAKETSSERRRELLRDVTDLYFSTQATCSDVESEHFGEILAIVTQEMHKEVRKEMAGRFAKEPVGPLQLLRQLANDEIDIAGPVLRHSPILQDTQLTDIIISGRQQHMQAISTRGALSQGITRQLIEHGNDQTLVTLVSNHGAQIDRPSMQTLVARSEQVPALQTPLVEHPDLPADLMNDMYLFAEEKVRARILARNEEIDPKLLQQAFSQAKTQITKSTDALPTGYPTAHSEITTLQQQGVLDGTQLLKFERDNDRLKFTLGLAALAKIDYQTVDRILQRQDVNGLALICRAIGFDPSLFTTIALLTSKDEQSNMGNSGKLRELYLAIPEGAAGRTLRFWQMRQKFEGEKLA